MGPRDRDPAAVAALRALLRADDWQAARAALRRAEAEGHPLERAEPDPGRRPARDPPATPPPPGRGGRPDRLTMKRHHDKIESLAQALAVGGSVARWAEAHHVPHRTAYRWAAEADVKARVHGLRQGQLAEALGQLAEAATAAVDTLKGLLAEKQPASVRLGAARAILAALIDVQTHAELADRVTRLEGLADAGRQDEA